jgi:hypothetical protein
VKINVPLLPLSSSSFSLNAKIAARAKAKAATTLVSSVVVTSSGVMSRKGFQTPCAVLKSAARRVEVEGGQWDWMEAKADWRESWV